MNIDTSFEVFRHISTLPSGPQKKFKLIKAFGKRIRHHHDVDGISLNPDILSCMELMEIVSKFIYADITDLAAHALCIDDDDYGSDRQIEAFNKFTNAAGYMMTQAHHEAWDRFSMKATSDEIVDEAMRIIKGETSSRTVRGEA